DQRAAAWIANTPGGAFVQVPESTAFAGSGSAVGDSVGPNGAAPPGRVSAGAAPEAGGASMDTVAGGALGVFATGSADGKLAMWYSTDGQHWPRLSRAEKVIGGADDAHITTLLVTPRGIDAAGSVRDGPHTDAALWTSGDGIDWRQVRTATTA